MSPVQVRFGRLRWVCPSSRFLIPSLWPGTIRAPELIKLGGLNDTYRTCTQVSNNISLTKFYISSILTSCVLILYRNHRGNYAWGPGTTGWPSTPQYLPLLSIT